MGQNFIAARLAHQFNFFGPNLVIDSACSSSLVSVQLACRSLLAGESEVAIAGGVDILLDEQPYLEFSAAKALSPSGRCAVFDQHADGFVPGEGSGLILLKPLQRALQDGDPIHAVIHAVAVNNDGQTMGLTTPSSSAQSKVVRQCLRASGFAAEEIRMIEAHGTGTMIGDPIELRALTDVFHETTQKSGFCAIGSVKSNLGHLLSAAGIAGLLKVVLSVEHAQIPPTLFCNRPNPRFEFASSPFFPNTTLQPWPGDQTMRAAGVSAFGLGGTNAHAIVSELERGLRDRFPQKRNPLPSPVFQRKRFWLERQTVQVLAPVSVASEPTPGAGGVSSILQLNFEPARIGFPDAKVRELA
jgi:acyl transferase domain-containing protein